jgi:hypothetical protein
MKRVTQTALIFLISFLPALSWAHPGHGEHAANEVTHYVLSPVHIWPIAAIIAISVVALLIRWDIKSAREEAKK